MTDREQQSLRIDRWLWFTRFFKTRVLAATAVSGGHLRINGERARPGSKVREGDIIELVRDQLPYKVVAARIPVRRGPATEARECYLEDEATRARREALRASLQRDRQQMPRTRGRPDKHTRRLLRERNRSGPDPD
jgi:ribosome-associated heat shock protein Hsp15